MYNLTCQSFLLLLFHILMLPKNPKEFWEAYHKDKNKGRINLRLKFHQDQVGSFTFNRIRSRDLREAQ